MIRVGILVFVDVCCSVGSFGGDFIVFVCVSFCLWVWEGGVYVWGGVEWCVCILGIN